MFAVIYRGFVLPSREKEYLESWEKIAQHFKEHCGARGTCLHRSEEGEYIAYSRWPNRETWSRIWEDGSSLPSEISLEIETLKGCKDYLRPHDEIHLDVLKDHLLP